MPEINTHYSTSVARPEMMGSFAIEPPESTAQQVGRVVRAYSFGALLLFGSAVAAYVNPTAFAVGFTQGFLFTSVGLRR